MKTSTLPTVPARLRALFIALSVMGLAGCTEFDPGSRVTTLRVLAVEADLPYARPGETVHLQALSFDPDDRALTWAWAACTNPSSQSVQDCLTTIPEAAAEAADSGTPVPQADGPEPGSQARPQLLQLGESSSLDFEVPSNTLELLPPETRASAQIGIVSVACPGTIEFETSRKTELPLRCLDDAERELDLDEFIVGIKHVRVRERDRNANPVLARIEFDGKAWPEDEIKTVNACATDDNAFDKCKSTSHELGAVVQRSSFEHGTSELGSDFKEQLVVQYYATEGIFENEVKIAAEPETRFAAREQSRGKEIQLWFVARDDRGGVTSTQRFLRVR